MNTEVERPEQFVEFSDATTRDRLLAALRFEVLGPEDPDEILSQSPATRYLVGMLAPQNTPLDSAEDEKETGDEEAGGGSDPPLTMSLAQSSIGLSFLVSGDVDAVSVQASWGEYRKVEKPEEVVAEEVGDLERDAEPESAPRRRRKDYEWHRIPLTMTVDLDLTKTGRHPSRSIGNEVEIDCIVRMSGRNRVVSVFLVNARRGPAGRRPPDDQWLYQPELLVRCPSGFIARQVEHSAPDPDPDLASADLVYRRRLEFATGHGVAAGWKVTPADADVAEVVWTDVVPDREVAPVIAWEAVDTPPSEMSELGHADRAEDVVRIIAPLLDAYSGWISQTVARISSVDPLHRSVARDHMTLAERCLRRMRGGLQLILDDPDAFAAFTFANRAMAAQLAASARVLGRRRGEQPPTTVRTRWRPFQIGFILQCLRGLAQLEDPEREIADLLWFPTGGGKTEAYLGLTAFALAYRRRRAASGHQDCSAGTVVLMRYTLRLLTIQQFQRATALICACELLRREDPAVWGEEPFTIGLWVGSSVTPNTFEEAKAALVRLKAGEESFGSSPYQVQFCPWCGRDLPPDHYTSDDDLERTLVKCDGEDCPFSMTKSELGLPVLLVDHEIYRQPPSLLLATVDKFAQMAWNGRIQSIFGRVVSRCPRHGFISAGENHPKQHQETRGWPAVVVGPEAQPLAPPDLIIQDELHLISGPLGTLVGIYESAVEGLCSRTLNGKQIRPKVVASTATIRRAAQQVHALFDRDVHVFPPQGIDVDDSFFARQDCAAPGRRYVGIYAPGKSVKTSLVRVYAAMLSRALVEFRRDPCAETDAYMTLVGYFNSLRELGGALRLIDDDVPARLRVLRRRGFGPNRLLYEKRELTSRARSDEITENLKRLDRTFIDKAAGAYPIDVLLASNMLSVGVDIDRLGLMVVSAQPKTSAEYIQATSRVGRRYPGLVIEVYNWVRPRDTSHYERFPHYHDTFYRHVEATSVTPWSARARDRALAGVLVAYLRMGDPQLATEQAANRFDPSHEQVRQAVANLVERAYRITSREDVRAETAQQLLNLMDEWHRFTAPPASRPIVYSGRGLKHGDMSKSVLLRQMGREAGRGLWPVATSLREVEEEIPVVLLDAPGSS